MKTTERTIYASSLRGAGSCCEFAIISELATQLPGSRVLAVNPRDGELLQGLISQKSAIDSFVSDDEWIDSAKLFSNEVYGGYSHHVLSDISDETYDLVFVCEDFGFVDDCDAMFREYYRLLKPGGALLGGVWNMNYADNIDKLLNAKEINLGALCGHSVIPLDCLVIRLQELGFHSMDVHSLFGDREDVSKYVEASSRNNEPMPPKMFNTKICFICAYK